MKKKIKIINGTSALNPNDPEGYYMTKAILAKFDRRVKKIESVIDAWNSLTKWQQTKKLWKYKFCAFCNRWKKALLISTTILWIIIIIVW